MSRSSKWRRRDTYRRVGELNGLQVEREQPYIIPLLLFCHIYNYAGVTLAIIRDISTWKCGHTLACDNYDLGHAFPFLLEFIYTPLHLIREKAHQCLVRIVHDTS